MLASVRKMQSERAHAFTKPEALAALAVEVAADPRGDLAAPGLRLSPAGRPLRDGGRGPGADPRDHAEPRRVYQGGPPGRARGEGARELLGQPGAEPRGGDRALRDRPGRPDGGVVLHRPRPVRPGMDAAGGPRAPVGGQRAPSYSVPIAVGGALGRGVRPGAAILPPALPPPRGDLPRPVHLPHLDLAADRRQHPRRAGRRARNCRRLSSRRAPSPGSPCRPTSARCPRPAPNC